MLWSARAGAPSDHGYGFETVAWTWTMVVQVGFLVAGTLVATGEYSGSQGRTTLLVTPVRWRVAAACAVVLGALSMVVAVVLVAVAVSSCPGGWDGAARATGTRMVAWLVAVAMASAGVGLLVRRTSGALTTGLLLVVVAPALAGILGEAGRWLPGVAGRDWVQAGTDAASGGSGAVAAGLTAVGWLVAAQAAGVARLLRSDA